MTVEALAGEMKGNPEPGAQPFAKNNRESAF